MDISNEIVSFLFSVGKVNLPGLGLLKLEKSSSVISPAKTKISGPKYSVKFIEKEFDEKIHHKFVEYLSNKYSKEKAYFEERIKKTSAIILNNVLNFGSTEIKNLGKIAIKDEKKTFEMMPFLQEVLDKSYPDLPMVYINRKNDIDFVDKKDNKNITGLYTAKKRKRNSKGWILPLIILTLISMVLVLLLYALFYVIDSGESKKTPSTKQTAIAIVKDTTTTKDSTLASEDKIFEQYAENDSSVSDTKNTPLKGNNDKGKKSKPKTKPKKNKKIKKKSTVANSDEYKDLDKINLTELLNFGPELINQYDKSCIIIVGSFIKKSNASKMLQKMYNDGFTPYVERYGEYHRTGVIFENNSV